MKSYIAIIMLLSISILGAIGLEQYQATGSGMRAQLTELRLTPMPHQEADLAEGDISAPTPAITKTYAFPFRNAQLQINRMKWNVFNTEGSFLYSEEQRVASAMSVVYNFQFREMRGVTVRIETQLENAETIRTLSEVDFELIGSEPIVIPETVSGAFIDAYKVLADNFDTSYLRDIAIARPKMLIISHAQLANHQLPYINWKRSLGFDVYVANKADIGNSIEEIKNFIAGHYQQYKCDYLLLLGDVNGTFAIPTSFYPSPEYASENDADDQYYVTFDGDDYFPEMLVGRFSISDMSEFVTIANKTIYHEKTPSMNNTAWMRRNLVVAGNYAEGGLRPSTPVTMSRWLRNKMLNRGYAQVDTVFYPPSYPGTSNIVSAINQGVQFISYRGWGDANGWHYPYFHMSDLNTTLSGVRMPIVFSIVCNTGDFANTVNPSFGERWMRMGSMAIPGGCVGFVGPSDLHTKTRYNNSISSGAFRSILDLGVRGFGSSVLMGKMELYKNFPNDIAPGQYVPFYFHVYNILSDPSLNMWVLVPNTIAETVIQGGLTFSQSTSYIRVEGDFLDGAMISGTKNGTTFSYATVQHGIGILPINPQETGDLTITISKPNYVPLVRTLTLNATASLGVVNNSIANAVINPGTNHTVSIGVKNFSTTTMTNVTANISSSYHGVSFTTSSQNIASLAPGAEANISFAFNMAGSIMPGERVNFIITFSNPTAKHEFQLITGGAKLRVISHQGLLTPGQNNSVQFTLTNAGNVAMNNISMQVGSLTSAATAQSAPIQIGNLNPGQSTVFNASITLPSNVWNGRNIPLRFEVSNGTGYQYTSFYSVTAGVASTTSPTGPDEYGYYAYDSTDLGFPQAPVYNWVEIDPRDGGQGSVFLNNDDGSKVVNMPISFRFYGIDYDTITICSNGWLSFGANDMVDFNNHYIPAALGPDAMVAPYWDDLKGMKVIVDSTTTIFNDMRMCYWYDAANNRYIVQWNDAYNQYTIDLLQNASLEKFQVILYPRTGTDGDIVFQYHTVDNPGMTTNYCTVGIEDHTQLRGLTYTHGNVYPQTATPLTAGLAIKFTTDAPDAFVSNDDMTSAVQITNLRNFPNPFNPSTTIAFNALSAGKASLGIYNLKGQLIKTLVDAELPSGEHSIVWDGTDTNGNLVGSGIYFYNFSMGNYKSTNKMLMMK